MVPTLEAVMSDLDDFLATTSPARSKPNKRSTTATPGRAWRCGSTQDPVTLLGAVETASG